MAVIREKTASHSLVAFDDETPHVLGRFHVLILVLLIPPIAGRLHQRQSTKGATRLERACRDTWHSTVAATRSLESAGWDQHAVMMKPRAVSRYPELAYRRGA